MRRDMTASFKLLGDHNDVNIRHFFKIQRNYQTTDPQQEAGQQCQEGCVKTLLQQQSSVPLGLSLQEIYDDNTGKFQSLYERFLKCSI